MTEPIPRVQYVSELGRNVESQLARQVTDERRRTSWRAATVDRVEWLGYAELGWFDARVAEAQGGLGLELPDVLEIFTALGRHLVPGPFFEHVVLVPLLIAAGAAGETLDVARSGAALISWCDPAATNGTGGSLRLVGAEELDGRATSVGFAADADAFVVTVEDDDGVPAVVSMPRSAHTSNEVSAGIIDGVRKPGALTADHAPCEVLLRGPDAAALISTARAQARAVVAFELCGIVDWLVTASLDYAKLREQFGRPIGTFQAISHILADMAVDSVALGNMCRELSESRPGADCFSPGHTLMMKAYAAQVSRRVSENALQVHGGIGFTTEHPLHLYFKRALSLHSYYGDPARLQVEIGRLVTTVMLS